MSTFGWLLVGAVLGFVAVVAVTLAGFSVPGWAGALVTALSATIFGGAGPIKRHDDVQTPTPAGA
jgi:hypothetical protein